MGNSGGKTKEIKGVRPNATVLDKARKEKRLITILLQGAGESGKSTILKQMKLIHGDGFDESYRKDMREKILLSILETQAAVIMLMFRIKKEVTQPAADFVCEAHAEISKVALETGRTPMVNLNDKVVAAMLEVSRDSNFIETVNNEGQSLVGNSFTAQLEKLNNFPAWGGSSWLPMDEDILESRVRTVGIVSQYFQLGDTLYQMLDVGGQRSERRRYMRLFSTVNQILFVASMADYDLKMYESPKENRLIDSVQMFNGLANSDTVKNCSLLVFLNKADLFKIKYYDNKIPLPTMQNFKSPPTVEEEENDKCAKAHAWFKDLYLSQAPPGRISESYVHVTTALDSNHMRTVIDTVYEYHAKQILESFAPMI